MFVFILILALKKKKRMFGYSVKVFRVHFGNSLVTLKPDRCPFVSVNKQRVPGPGGAAGLALGTEPGPLGKGGRTSGLWLRSEAHFAPSFFDLLVATTWCSLHGVLMAYGI